MAANPVSMIQKSRLSRRLMLWVVSGSLLITILVVCVQVFLTYRRGVAAVDHRLDRIATTSVPGIAASVFSLDDQLLNIQLAGLLNFPDVVYVAVFDADSPVGPMASRGDINARRDMTREYDLIYEGPGGPARVYGKLVVSASLAGTLHLLWQSGLYTLISSAGTISLVAIGALLVFHYLINRHLIAISAYTDRLSLEEMDQPLLLKRSAGKAGAKDEIDRVADAINGMRMRLGRDLAARRKAETALRESEALLNETQRLAKIGGWNYDLTKRSFMWTDEMYRIHGLPVDPSLDKRDKSLACCREQDRPVILEAFHKCVNQGKAYDLEFAFHDHQGRSRWIRAFGRPVRNPRGEIVRVVGTIMDLTEKKQAEKAFAKSHQTLLTVLDSIDATIYVADLDTYEILFMNRFMREAYGKDLTGRKCFAAFRNDQNPCEHCTNPRLVDDHGRSTGLCVWEGENPVTGRWYMNYDRAIQWVDGRTVKLQIATDITERRQKEQDRLSQERQQRQAHKMEAIGTIAGGIAHDFNNILGIIIGNIELALDDVPAWHAAHDNLKEIMTAGLRARDVVRQLLSFSRPSEQQPQPVNLQVMINDTVTLLRASIPSTIDIRLALDEPEIVVQADPTQIQQVLINLATNAGQAMEGGGTLTLSLDRQHTDRLSARLQHDLIAGTYARIMIDDTGCGITKRDQERIFDPYFTTREVGKGAGMGLAIAHGIVKGCGGAISVDSQPGKGCRFSVFLPIHHLPADSRAGAVKAMPSRGSETILLVDDEAAILTMGRQQLERLGYVVDVFVDPVAAVTAVQTDPRRYDLVITDLTMPHMTGDQLAAAVLKCRSDLPIILCTGYNDVLSTESGGPAGFCSCITKPFDRLTLATAVRSALDHSPMKPQTIR